MVSSDFGKLDARRHFTSGNAEACARLSVGITVAPAARPTPADFRNFLRSMIPLLRLKLFRGRSLPENDLSPRGGFRHSPAIVMRSIRMEPQRFEPSTSTSDRT